MTALTQTNSNKQFIPAGEFFALVRTSQDFTEWLCRRIYDFEMELNHDFYIFLSSEAVRELSKMETFRDRNAHKLITDILKENG
jgi:phage anti-repressor protein